MTDEPTLQNEHNVKYISFTLNDLEFCIDIMAVREIRGWTQPTPIPHSPEYVCGVINLRGAVLPIIDFAARLGMPSADPTASNVIIVTQVGDRLVGILVDGVSDILSIDMDNIQPVPDTGAESSDFFKGILALEDKMMRLVELEAVVPAVSVNIAA